MLNHLSLLFLLFFVCCNPVPGPPQINEPANKIKVDFSKNDWILLKATLQNKDSGTFLLDNGTLRKLYIDKEFAKRHNYLLDVKYRADSSYYYSNSLDKRPYTFKLGNFSDTSHETAIFDLSKTLGAKIDGLIGYGFLKKYVLYISYKDHFVQFFTNDSMINKHEFEGIPLTKGRSFPRFPVSLFYKGLNIKDSAILDLGYSSGSIFIGGGTVRKHNLKQDHSKLVKGGSFVTGEKNIVLADTIDSLRIGETTYIKNAKVEFSKSEIRQGTSGQDIILIGNGVLKKQYDDIYVDLINSILYLPKSIVK